MSGRAKHVCFYSKKCPYSKMFLEELAKTPYTSEFQFVCVDPSPNRPPLPKWLRAVPTLVIDGESEPLTDEKVFNWLSFRRIQGNTPASAPRQQYQEYVEPPPPAVSAERMMPTSMPRYDPGIPDQRRQGGGGVGGGVGGGNGGAPRSLPEPIQTRTSGNTISQPPQQQPIQVGGGGADDGSGPAAYHGAEMASGSRWTDSYSFLNDQFTCEKGINPIERNFASLLGPGAGGIPQQSARPEPESEKAKALNSAYDNYMKEREKDFPLPQARR